MEKRRTKRKKFDCMIFIFLCSFRLGESIWISSIYAFEVLIHFKIACVYYQSPSFSIYLVWLQVYAYYRSLPMPIASYKFGSIDPISGKETDDDNGQFVSSVCWRKNSDMLVAANSTGCIKVLQMVWSCKTILETDRNPLRHGLSLWLRVFTNQICEYKWVQLLTIHGRRNDWKSPRFCIVYSKMAQTGTDSTSCVVVSQQFL